MKSLFSSFFCWSLLAGLLFAGGRAAQAQAPGWQSARAVAVATTFLNGNYSDVTATAVDAAGNVLLAGNFRNTVALGSTTLTSLGDQDVFVAKFNPVTNQFVWAQRAGGIYDDKVSALVVSGTSVYVAGSFSSPTAGFGTNTLTNTRAGVDDAFVAKLTDAGSTGSFVWAQGAGGSTNVDHASALAVSGTSVYVAGSFVSSPATFGTINLNSAGYEDVFVAKLTDAGSTGSWVWAQRAGGVNDDLARALTVSGTSVYVAGSFLSQTAGFGPVTLAKRGRVDVFVAKLTDAGTTGSFVWAQRAGSVSSVGLSTATALAANGTSVYMAGLFEGTGDFSATTLPNGGVFVAKLIDAGSMGSFVWAQGGGSGYDRDPALAISGTSIFVAGSFNSPAYFGTTILANAGADDVFVTKLTDAGTTGRFLWAQRAGGTDNDRTAALAVSGTSVYVAGLFSSPIANFSPIALPSPTPTTPVGFLATLTDATLTATTTSRALAPAALWPNPARGTATLRLPAGTAPAPLMLSDALGRTVRQYPAPAGPEAVLDLRGLPAGLYLLRGAGPATRLLVE